MEAFTIANLPILAAALSLEVRTHVPSNPGSGAYATIYEIDGVTTITQPGFVTDSNGALLFKSNTAQLDIKIGGGGTTPDLAWNGGAAFWVYGIATVDIGTLNTSVAAAAASATAAETAETNAETAQTAAELAETNAETAQTAAAASASAAAADAAATAADLVATNQDTIDTAADLVATNQDTIDTAADAAATAADLVATNQDTIDTAADASSASTSATNAASSATAAATSATEAAASAASIDPTKLLHTEGNGGGDPEGYTIAQVDALISGADLINGGFNVWQEGTSQTSHGYGSDDQWSNNHSGSTKTHTRQAFTLGQTSVAGNPKYYSRTVVASSAGAANYVSKIQPIERVAKLAGKTITLSFDAKADASKNIAIELHQVFGTGGSPSADVTGIGSQKIALTTSWQRLSAIIAVPSVSGKTLGTNNNDSLKFAFWFDAGSDYNTRTDTLGQQSGTFEIANVQIKEGSVATAFEQRQLAIEELLCYRYFERFTYENGGNVLTGQAYNATSVGADFTYIPKRAIPTITFGGTGSLAFVTASGGSAGGTVYAAGISIANSNIKTLTASGLVAGDASTLFSTGQSTIDVDARL